MLLLLMPVLVKADSLQDPFLVSAPEQTASIITLHFLKAKTISDWLMQKSTRLLSSNGSASAYEDRNVLIIYDGADEIGRIKTLLKQLDQPKSQVEIKAEIISIDTNALQSLGMLFQPANNATTNGDHLNFNLPITKPNSVIMPILNFSQRQTLNLEINALAEQGKANIISQPEVTTQDNQTAVIESGDEIPYQEATSSGATSATFRKAVLRLEVMPSLMPLKQILLQVTINQDKVSKLTVQGVPGIKTQKIATQVLLKDDHTLVLGGIFEDNNSKTQQGIPFLQNVPLIGKVFTHTNDNQTIRELLILIQARELPFNPSSHL